ncbi:hypothetical protein BKA67DRAFT_540296 [Truncatella angustata]|uniref:Uncharacterized protein n=1 Tax=Truncatella angustata TaxID=152316 RepID=A0A9P8RJ57_9PEZI|nr:uncharacterized protein BKA67DRAFT_540296 [Truncatella angustata]KAH6646814.1 hypothetical protein BKA67DRAFT_540296 [Truncatella angustata]
MRRHRPNNLEPSLVHTNQHGRPPTPYPFNKDGTLRGSRFESRKRDSSIQDDRVGDLSYKHVLPTFLRRQDNDRPRKLSYSEKQHNLQRAIDAANARIDRRPAIPRQHVYFPAKVEKHVRFKLPRMKDTRRSSPDDEFLSKSMANLGIAEKRSHLNRQSHCEACGRRLVRLSTCDKRVE